MVTVFLQFESIWLSLATRSGQGHVKKCQIFKWLILKYKDLFLMQNVPQESNGVICFSVRGLEPPKITFDCMTSLLGVML